MSHKLCKISARSDQPFGGHSRKTHGVVASTPLCGRGLTFGGRGETKTQGMEMKFSTLVIDLGESTVSIYELAQTNKNTFYNFLFTHRLRPPDTVHELSYDI